MTTKTDYVTKAAFMEENFSEAGRKCLLFQFLEGFFLNARSSLSLCINPSSAVDLVTFLSKADGDYCPGPSSWYLTPKQLCLAFLSLTFFHCRRISVQLLRAGSWRFGPLALLGNSASLLWKKKEKQFIISKKRISKTESIVLGLTKTCKICLFFQINAKQKEKNKNVLILFSALIRLINYSAN